MYVARRFRLVLELLMIGVGFAVLLGSGVLAHARPASGQASARPALAAESSTSADKPEAQARAILSETSPPLRDLSSAPVPLPPQGAANPAPLPRGQHKDAPDPVVQRAFGPGGPQNVPAAPSPSPGWEGLSADAS